MKLWRMVSLSFMGLGLLYIISDLVYDFFGVGWFVLRVQLCPTMVYGLFCLTWGIIIWWKFADKK